MDISEKLLDLVIDALEDTTLEPYIIAIVEKHVVIVTAN